ncbi:MAG: ATP-binding protein [Actinobacteria bacterium]|nr:MAG: ATP-binding protein [Actinomycetota bacterium]
MPLRAYDGEEAGIVLGRRLRGEPALPCHGGLVVLSPRRMTHHLLVMGATGAGKTETALRIAYCLAQVNDAPVFFLDGKGDRRTAARFVGLMKCAGRTARVFPDEPFDGWRGGAGDVQARLTEVIDYAAEGPAAWYRDVAKAVLTLVCRHPDGPPRCSAEALSRMELRHLRSVHGPASAAVALTAEQVRGVRLRYEAFFGQLDGRLDGGWGWDDSRAAYLLLDTLALREEARGLARFLFEDFAHYFTARKARERFCVLIVDEFSALASSGSMAARIEQARAFNTALILAPQVAAGMGEAEEAARILASVETVVCHRVNTPDAVVALAGTRQALERTHEIADAGPTGNGTAWRAHHFKVDPNEVRGLDRGEAFVIAQGRAMKVRVAQAPTVSAPLEDAVPQYSAATPTGSRAHAREAPTSSERGDDVPAGRCRSERGGGLPF